MVEQKGVKGSSAQKQDISMSPTILGRMGLAVDPSRINTPWKQI
jgi:hypothetical protein